MPYGSPADDPATESVCGLGNRKDELVVGVDRGDGGAALRQHGADIVVKDLAELIPS